MQQGTTSNRGKPLKNLGDNNGKDNNHLQLSIKMQKEALPYKSDFSLIQYNLLGLKRKSPYHN